MAEHSWPRAVDLLFDLVACEVPWVVDEQTDDLCVVVAFVPQFEREVVVAPNVFRNRTELGETDAETGEPACAVGHLLPVRLPPRVAVLLEQVEDLGLCHGTRYGADSAAGGRYFFAGAFPPATGLRSNAPSLSTKNRQSEALSQEVVCR